jgi:hypothetical protein
VLRFAEQTLEFALDAYLMTEHPARQARASVRFGFRVGWILPFA